MRIFTFTITSFLYTITFMTTAAKSIQSIPSTEGVMTWKVPNAEKPGKTWYKIYGDLKSGKRPLVTLHGGPGASSDYFSIFTDLTTSHSIPVILYDQIGTGQSTHFPEKMGDVKFWTEQLFLDELNLLLRHLGIYRDYDLLGHSWGGMLGSSHAVHQPGGLNRLILMSSPISMKLWVEAQEVLRRRLPQNIQDALDKNERDGTTDSEEYQAAVGYYYSKHLCLINPLPEPIAKGFGWIEKDPTVYFTMNGPSEFFVTGSLKTWTIEKEAHRIAVPTLLTNGYMDEAADSVMAPFFKSIPNVRWFQFANSSHMAHFEEREKYFKVIGDFLTE